MSQRIEIMAPAGSWESVRAAAKGGAGSVYFGVGRLNMRSRSSQNFSIDDLKEIASFCREVGMKSYVTLNTIVYDHELDEMRKVANACKEAGVSAIIASDLSVLQYVSSIKQEIHISTQCNITNIEAVEFFSKFADVMVLARELSLDQVKRIHRQIIERDIRGPKGNLVELELFAHGALCMAVSGKCYLSLDNMNSSANRGACLQVCRRPYKVTDMEGEIELEIDNEYIMSPKDLSTIGFIDQIVDAGVSVLKIEGRGRSPEYVMEVTRVYREAVDAIQAGQYTSERIEGWKTRLSTVYNRGFWDGYYLGQKLGEWSEGYGSKASRTKKYIGKVTNYFSNIGVAEFKLETDELKAGDSIIINGPTTGVVEHTVGEVRLDLTPVAVAPKGSLCSVALPEMVRRQDKLFKWVESE